MPPSKDNQGFHEDDPFEKLNIKRLVSDSRLRQEIKTQLYSALWHNRISDIKTGITIVLRKIGFELEDRDTRAIVVNEAKQAVMDIINGTTDQLGQSQSHYSLTADRKLAIAETIEVFVREEFAPNYPEGITYTESKAWKALYEFVCAYLEKNRKARGSVSDVAEN